MCVVMSGQRDASNPQATLASLLAKREKLQEELRQVEKQVYDLETTYLQDSSQVGNVLKGFEGFLSSSKGAGNLKRTKKFQPEDRLFSLSSVTAPVTWSMYGATIDVWECKSSNFHSRSIMQVEELAAGRDADGRMDGIGQSRSKITGLQSNGPGKPKRGRTQSRDTKRIKHASELDFDDDDDADRASR